jgi:hypothetical protein
MSPIFSFLKIGIPQFIKIYVVFPMQGILFHAKFYCSHRTKDSWATSFDHGNDNDSLWNFSHKVGFYSCFVPLCHVVEMLLYLALTSVICFSGW